MGVAWKTALASSAILCFMSFNDLNKQFKLWIKVTNFHNYIYEGYCNQDFWWSHSKILTVMFSWFIKCPVMLSWHIKGPDDLSSNFNYRKVSNTRRTLVGNEIVDHSDVVVVGASPVGAAPTTFHSQLNTWLQWIGQRQQQDDARNVYVWGLGAPYIRELTVSQDCFGQ